MGIVEVVKSIMIDCKGGLEVTEEMLVLEEWERGIYAGIECMVKGVGVVEC